MGLHLDPAKTALILIDVQAGTLAFPLAPYDRDALVATSERLGRAFAEAGATIVLVNVAFSPDGGDRPSRPIDLPMMLPPDPIPAEFSALAPEIEALPASVRITKHQWSAFYGTELDLQLRRRGIDTIVLGGIATNFGVESTARHAWELGYAVVLAGDLCTSMSAELHAMSMKYVMPRLARIVTCDQIGFAAG